MNHRSKFVFPFVCLLALCFASPAMAGGDDLTAPLGEIDWGDSRAEVAKKVKAQMLEKLRQREDLKGNRVLLHREHARVLAQIDEFKESYEVLDDSSGYRVSVISDEFSRGNGESLMRIKDTVANRYYFFVDGGLYKLVVAYNQQYLKSVGFETFVVQVANKYGKPGDTTFVPRDGEDVLMNATWKDANTVLSVQNQKEFFGTFTMSFAQRTTVERLKKMRLARGDSDDSDDGLSARVKSLTSVTNPSVDADIVDSIVGSSDFNLNEGRPVDVQKARAEQAKRQAELAAQKKLRAKAEKKARAEKKKEKKKTRKKRDFSDIEASSGGGGDLIIY
jgi:hypothetical protein